MRLLHRESEADRPDEAPAGTTTPDPDVRHDRADWRSRLGFRGRDEGTDTSRDTAAGRPATAAVVTPDADHDGVPDTGPRRRRRLAPARREYAHRPFHIGNLLAMIAGGALAVIGIVALVRGDLDDTWNSPVTTVLDIDHTPLTAVLEIAAGVLLLLLAATGVRLLALLGAAGLAVAAAAVAIEPGRLATDYALETWWAWTVMGVAAFVALVLLLPSRRRSTRSAEPEVGEPEPAVR
jgi:hypothetical protein